MRVRLRPFARAWTTLTASDFGSHTRHSRGLWASCAHPSIERDTVQGIILAAAALVHHQKDEDAISLSILARAAKKLHGAPAEYGGINIAAVRDAVSSMISSRSVGPFMIRPSTAQS